MHDDTQRAAGLDRLWMGLLGALAGAAAWGLVAHFDGSRLMLGLMALVFGTFGVFFALSGPARLGQAAAAAVALVLPATLLFLWASFRFAGVADFLDSPAAVAAFVAIVTVGTPFAAAQLQWRGGWRDYATLFSITWTIILRYGLAWLFTGVFWLLLILADQLLRIVGLEFIGDLVEIDWVPFTLTGAALGVALAVVHELRDTLSPVLVVRLLRVLLPPVVAVVAIFLVAVPVRGLSGLFGSLSAAATLMAVTVALLTLVTLVVDRDDPAAARAGLMRGCAMAGALLVPLLAGLALAAVLIRVAQYGWTPDRVTAAAAALVLVIYGIGYAGAVLLRAGWMARLREVNLWMALVTIGVSALWLTPVLNPQRIATDSQVARFASGATPAAHLPLYEMAHDWGVAGARGIEELAAMADHPERGELVALIEAARAASYRDGYLRATRGVAEAELRQELRAAMPVRPTGARLPEDAFAGMQEIELRRWLDACERPLPDGRPGCVAVAGDFRPAETAPQAMIVLLGDAKTATVYHATFGAEDRPRIRQVFDPSAATWPQLQAADVARLLDGDFAVGPSSLRSLRLGEVELTPAN
ncbi:hypothetical protein [Pseudooceanicola sp. LIPI14-2-Ac024]|uniref:hypothetical protein n=1 Tax=Pseudooceanicola sp. LIPI14-2-Ac024 TaxID=3344875 RepID=UPI0035CF3317